MYTWVELNGRRALQWCTMKRKVADPTDKDMKLNKSAFPRMDRATRCRKRLAKSIVTGFVGGCGRLCKYYKALLRRAAVLLCVELLNVPLIYIVCVKLQT